MKTFLEQLNSKRLRSYDADPGLLKEHFGIEEAVLAGGYGYRQILELVQNGADALLEAREAGDTAEGAGRIHVQLHGSRLYVANTGAPLSEGGLDALLRSHSSPKRGNQIGRFGLGFKSLLKLNGRIDVFTRVNGAIRFDPEKCRAELSRQFKVAATPGLRLAWALPSDERIADPICAELAWAETIIRVEVGSEILMLHIQQEIRSFPAEFLLFFPLATKLTLDDGRERAREIRKSIEGSEHILHDAEAVSRWRIAAHDIRITEARAIADATHIHARESVPVSWAMPLEGRREEAGRFWAFFPTQTQTYLPGILNAPWKLNSDRNAIISGEWNAALMAEAAKLVADALPGLATADDPARPLDAFPRQLDRKDEDAAPLIESLWMALKSAVVVPDGTGARRYAQELWRHPKDTLELASAWQSLAGAEQQRRLVHASCLKGQRASRLNALADRIEAPATGQSLPSLRRSSTESWFGMVAAAEPNAALEVLRLAESFSIDVKTGEWGQIRPRLAIAPTQSGRLVTSASIVLAPEGVAIPDRETVAAGLLAIAEARRLLKAVLGVSEPDDQLWLSILAAALNKVAFRQPEADEAGWQGLWARLRLAPGSALRHFLGTRGSEIRARRRDGQWAQPSEVLLPGSLVPESDTDNGGLLVDPEVHGSDRPLLDLIGVKSDLHGTDELTEVRHLQVFEGWRKACEKRWFDEAFRGGSRPQDGYLQPLHGALPKGFHLLDLLRGGAKSRLTLALCKGLQDQGKGRIAFGHSTRTDSYPKIQAQHPLSWLLLSHGDVEISAGANAPLRALFACRKTGVLQRLPIWPLVSPALGRLEDHFPAVTASPGDLRILWRAVIAGLATSESISGDALLDLWHSAAKDGVVPIELPSPTGRTLLSGAFVTTSADLARRARTPGRVVVVLDPPTMQHWLAAGAQNLAGLIRAEWGSFAGPPERLTG